MFLIWYVDLFESLSLDVISMIKVAKRTTKRDALIQIHVFNLFQKFDSVLFCFMFSSITNNYIGFLLNKNQEHEPLVLVVNIRLFVFLDFDVRDVVVFNNFTLDESVFLSDITN